MPYKPKSRTFCRCGLWGLLLVVGMKIILLGILTGLLSGVIAALCGVGGGLVMVPIFTLGLGLSQKTAVATSLAVIIPTALAASSKNVSHGLVHWPLFASTALGATVAAFFMADKLKQFQDQTLTRIFACVVIAMGVLMWTQAKPQAAQASASQTTP